MPDLPERPTIAGAANRGDRYSGHREIEAPEHAEFRRELQLFCELKAAGEHSRGIGWFLTDGLDGLNHELSAAGYPTIDSMFAENTVRKFIYRAWKHLAPSFKRKSS